MWKERTDIFNLREITVNNFGFDPKINIMGIMSKILGLDKEFRKIKIGVSNPPRLKPDELTNTNYLCSYGCGNIAKFRLRNGKHCCSEWSQQCPVEIGRASCRERV